IQDVGGNYFDGSGFNSGSAVLLPAQGTVGNWTYNNSSLSFTNDHRYDVTAKATDNAGNSATATNRFTYDLSKPTSTISTPQAPYMTSLTSIAGTATDNLGSVFTNPA